MQDVRTAMEWPGQSGFAFGYAMVRDMHGTRGQDARGPDHIDKEVAS